MSRRAEIEFTPAADDWATWAAVNETDPGARDIARQIVASRPRPIEAGVRVKDVQNDQGTVIAVHNDHAWVDFDEFAYPVTYSFDDLEVLP